MLFRNISTCSLKALIGSNNAPDMLRKVIIPAVAIAAVAIIMLIVTASLTPAETVELRGLAAGLELRMDNAIDVMESTSSDPEVQQTRFLSLVDEAHMGIPEDADMGKRDVAREILLEHSDVASIFFLTPDGNLYMGEPYEQQAQLPRLNYSDRDWYQGVSSTNDAYTSSVFMSAAIHEPAVAVAVPVESESETIGYWVAIISLEEVENVLKDRVIGGRVIFVDHNGLEVADSAKDSDLPRTELQSFSDLQAVKEALEGRSGSLVEQVDGNNMKIYYAPMNIYPHTWAAVMITPP